MLNAFFTCYFSSRYVVVSFILISFYPSPQITREGAGLSNRTFLIDVTALYVLQQPRLALSLVGRIFRTWVCPGRVIGK